MKNLTEFKTVLMENDWTGLKLIKKVLHPKIAQPSLNLSLGVPYFENWRLYNKNLVLIWLSLFEFGYVSLGIVLSSQVRFGC